MGEFFFLYPLQPPPPFLEQTNLHPPSAHPSHDSVLLFQTPLQPELHTSLHDTS
mgnify:CR=1 FL=1